MVDPAPIARDDGALTDARTPVLGSVLADNGNGADGDPDGDPLAVVAVDGSAAGVGQAVTGSAGGRFTVLADGRYRFDPGADFDALAAGRARTTRIAYTIDDGNGGAFSDVDVGDVLTFSATGLPPGLALDRATGLISGTVASDASTRVPGGVYAITLTGTDSAGASATARFTITLGNPDPVARDDTAALDEDGLLDGHVLDNDADPDGDAIRVDPTTVAGPLHGRLDLRADGSFTYRPEAGFHGEDAFTYAVVDADGGRSTATVRLTVAFIDAPPTAIAAAVTTREGTPVAGRIIADDREGGAPAFSVEVPPASGQVSLRPDGSFTYTPGTDFHGDDGFTVRVSDEAGGSTLIPVAATIVAVNDAPDAHADDLTISAGEVGRRQVVATDRDGDPLAFRLVGIRRTGRWCWRRTDPMPTRP